LNFYSTRWHQWAGIFLKPRHDEDQRISKWVADRIDGGVGPAQSAVGLVRQKRDLELAGLGIGEACLDEDLAICSLADDLGIDAHSSCLVGLWVEIDESSGGIG